MQENNFEKQVQQKMEDFRVTPASEVWQKVELEIIRKKRNWRVLFMIAFITILLGTAGVGWWNFSITPTTSKLSTANQSQRQLQNTLNDSMKKYSANNANTKSESDKAADFVKGKGDSNSTNNLSNKINKQEQQLAGQNRKARAVEIEDAFNENQEIANENEYKPTKKISGRREAITTTSISNSEIEEMSDNSIAAKQNQQMPSALYLPKIDGAGILINSSIKNNTQTVIVNDDSVIIQLKKGLQNLNEQQLKIFNNKAQTTNIKPLKWQVGLTVSLGVSTTRDSHLGIVGITSTEEDKVFADPLQVNNGNTGTATQGVPQKPSKIKLDKAFVIGAIAKRSIAPGLSIVTGVNYKFYSTKMLIGGRFDSVGTFSTFAPYYRTGSSISYNNYFHFIEVPFSLQWKILKGRLPLYIDAGFTITQLIKTKALQYNAATNYYYDDNSLFKKTSVNISSKLLIDISKHSRQLFLVGPELNFSIGSMSENGLYQKKHFGYLGISFQKTIGKK